MGCCSSTVPSASEEVNDRFLDNVHVWQTIFEMLPVKDQIRLEMTNKRLGILMLEYWKRVTSFDTRCLTQMSYSSWIRGSSINRWAAFVAICANRTGDGLRSLTIRDMWTCPNDCWSIKLRSIGKVCPNIETMNFIHSFSRLDIYFDSFSRLKTLTVVSTRGGDFMSASASVFLSIPTSIEVIRGLGGHLFQPFANAAQMEGFFADRPSLREVSLGDLYTRDKRKADIFRVIAERCPHLRTINLYYTYCIDYIGVVALESMKELRLPRVVLNEMDIVTICERSPLVEALELRLAFSSNIHPQSAALNALGSLTKLRELWLSIYYGDVFAPSLVTEFVHDLARNSGASLRRLRLEEKMPLSTGAIEALANGCGKLRDVEFFVHVGAATPASIRFLIDCIVAHPSWIHETGEPTLVIRIDVRYGNGSHHEYTAGRAALKALADPAANLPSGVQLKIC